MAMRKVTNVGAQEPTMVYDCIRRVLVVAHGKKDPTDAEWARWIDRMALRDYDGILILTQGGGPTGPQRAATARFWKEQPHAEPAFAAVTQSAMVRGILTAFRWLGISHMPAYAPHDIDKAFDHLRVEPSSRPMVTYLSGNLQRNLSEGKAA